MKGIELPPEIRRLFKYAANETEKAWRTVKPLYENLAPMAQDVCNKAEHARRTIEPFCVNLPSITESPAPTRMVVIEQEWEPDEGAFWTNLAEIIGEVPDSRHGEPTAGADKPGHKPEMDHSPDFSTVKWGEETFTFTMRQAACVCLMWDQFERRTAFLSSDYIMVNAADNYREKTNLDSKKLKRLEYSGRFRDVFKDHEAWGKMIQKKGTNLFGLVAPPD